MQKWKCYYYSILIFSDLLYYLTFLVLEHIKFFIKLKYIPNINENLNNQQLVMELDFKSTCFINFKSITREYLNSEQNQISKRG